jgi:hypothetical protein
VVAAGTLVGAAVAYVEDRLVGREGQAVGLVARVVDDGQSTGTRVEAIDEVTHLGLGSEVLKEPVRRIGEPDAAIGAHDDVVR